jgi:hypothetical protein
MNEALSADDRRHVRTSLIASLAVVITLLLSTFAWAGVNPPAAEGRVPTLTAAAPAAPGAAEEGQNTMVGCGCAEGCFSGS